MRGCRMQSRSHEVRERQDMYDFEIEVTGPDAEVEARSLAKELAPLGRVAVQPLDEEKGLDPVTIIIVMAAVIQSIDIIYHFYEEFRQKREAGTRSGPTVTIILHDGTRIQLADTDLEGARLLIEASE
jgi:hypothetical protein